MKIDIGAFKNFIFDFDGVIIDTVNIKTEAFKELYLPFGKDIAAKACTHHVSHGGISRFEKIRYYHKVFLNQDLSQVQIAELADKFSAIVFDKVVNAPLIPGAKRFLDLLSLKKMTMYIISSTPEEELCRIVKMRKLDAYFRDIKGSPATKEDNLRYLINHYGLKSTVSVYFGDSGEDLHTAKLFNLEFIPINYFSADRGYKDFDDFLGQAIS